MRSVCPSARVASRASLEGWTLRYDKPSRDGSAHASIRPDPFAATPGVIYEIEDGERQALDAAAPGYAGRRASPRSNLSARIPSSSGRVAAVP